MILGIVISLLVAGLLCWLASMLIPAGVPQYIAYVVIILACLGGYIGFGGRIAHGFSAPASDSLPSAH
jgi:hypothetical protein